MYTSQGLGRLQEGCSIPELVTTGSATQSREIVRTQQTTRRPPASAWRMVAEQPAAVGNLLDFLVVIRLFPTCRDDRGEVSVSAQQPCYVARSHSRTALCCGGHNYCHVQKVTEDYVVCSKPTAWVSEGRGAWYSVCPCSEPSLGDVSESYDVLFVVPWQQKT